MGIHVGLCFPYKAGVQDLKAGVLLLFPPLSLTSPILVSNLPKLENNSLFLHFLPQSTFELENETQLRSQEEKIAFHSGQNIFTGTFMLDTLAANQ